MENKIDNCKKCGAYSLECDYCKNYDFYRHIDDKRIMRSNLVTIRFIRANELRNIIGKTK